MRSKKLLIVVLFALGITFIQANDKVVKFRAESIHCGGCTSVARYSLQYWLENKAL
jgi:hypothetical protein